MTQPFLTDVFPGATQNSIGVTIPWSAIPGITASVTTMEIKPYYRILYVKC